jgi:hypothetical protein
MTPAAAQHCLYGSTSRRRSLPRLVVGCSVFGCFAAAAAGWSTFAIDDSMTRVTGPAAQLQWRDAMPSTRSAPLLDATLDVHVVLNVGGWIGRPARIYMQMPAQPQTGMRVHWTTRGQLLPGQLSAGGRQLVYQGVIGAARLEDDLRVTATVDARDPAPPVQTRFGFEIEVATP